MVRLCWTGHVVVVWTIHADVAVCFSHVVLDVWLSHVVWTRHTDVAVWVSHVVLDVVWLSHVAETAWISIAVVEWINLLCCC